MAAYGEQDEAIAGLPHGINKRVRTLRCGESAGIPFGHAVMVYSGDRDGGYSMKQDELLLTFSADLVTSNSIALTINGTALTPVVFATSHNDTMDLLKAAIEAVFTTAAVTLPDISTNRQIKVYIKDTIMSGSGVVTGGASQATITATLSSAQVFAGVSGFVHKEYAGVAKYNLNEAMNVLHSGEVWVETSETVQAHMPAYIVQSGASAGKFATSGYATNARYKSNVTGAGLALVEVIAEYDGI